MKQITIILLAAIFSSQVLAMSKPPEPYNPPVWTENASASKDAAIALKNKDFRLLAYITRNTMVPGINQEEKELLSKICGLRIIDSFGDVVRSGAQLQKMRAMHDYAENYNKIIAAQCKIAKPGSSQANQDSHNTM